MMSDNEYAKLRGRAPWYFLGGVAVAACGFFPHPFITLTGFMAVALGASAMGFNHDLMRQPLMWIVSGLVWLVCLFMYAANAYLEICELIDGDASVLAAVALAVLTSILWLQSRFLLTFTRINWRATR